MRKILLVDDDSFFRTMFAALLPWSSYGFTLLQAGNGRDAIELLHRNSDIVLLFTDMDMPILDGVELIRYTTEHFHDVRCIALSAYDDFSYVRPSLKNGADDYLLKHTLTKSQLVEILQRYAAVSPGTEPAKTDNAELTARFLFDYITGAYRNVPELESLFTTLSLPVLTKDLLLMLLIGEEEDGRLPFRGGEKASRHQLDTACCMLQGQLEQIGYGTAFFGQDGLLYLLATSDGFSNLQFVKQATQVLTGQIERMMLQYFNLTAHLLCAPLCRRAEDIAQSYQALMEQINRAPLQQPQQEIKIRLPGEEELHDELYFGTEESARRLVADVYLEGRKRHLSQNRFSELTVEFLQRLSRTAERMGLPADCVLHFTEGHDSDQETYVTKVLRRLQEEACKAAAAHYSALVLRALRVIYGGLCNCTLSPASVSEQLHVNPAYLSRLFKAQVHQNISDYISEKRMKKACSLLENDAFTVKEAAALSGYENYNYFFRVFKKHMGITPGEYQIRAISSGEE